MPCVLVSLADHMHAGAPVLKGALPVHLFAACATNVRVRNVFVVVGWYDRVVSIVCRLAALASMNTML
jgi:hypothetical protein